jgi:tetratricopeptide (TPR) repeat protein
MRLGHRRRVHSPSVTSIRDERHDPSAMNGSAQTLRTTLLSAMVLCLAVVALLRNAEYQSATALWEQSAMHAPGKQRPHFNLGQGLSREGRYAEALEQFRIVSSLPDDGSTTPAARYRELGVAYLGLGLYDEAANAWLRGLDAAPAEWSLLNNLALVRRRQGRLDEALALAGQALGLDSSRPETLALLADIWLEKGEPHRAVEYLGRYLSVRSEEPRAHWGMALALQQAGNYPEALVYAKRFFALEQDPEYRQRAAELVEELRGQVGRN